MCIRDRIFTEQGKAIGSKAKDNCKILVVGNPANTNALIGHHNANNANQTWMAMTMLDALRAKAQLSIKLNCHVDDIYRLAVFGNHSPTMFPDLENTIVNGQNAYEQINDHSWVCLLYTSDAADDLTRVDLGGRRIIKKKKFRCRKSKSINFI